MMSQRLSAAAVGGLAGKICPRLSLPSGFDPNGLSHDAQEVQSYAHDPLVFTTANDAWYRESRLAQARVLASHAMPVPCLYVFSSADPIASPAVNVAYGAALQGVDATVQLRDGADVREEVAQWFVEHRPHARATARMATASTPAAAA